MTRTALIATPREAQRFDGAQVMMRVGDRGFLIGGDHAVRVLAELRAARVREVGASSTALADESTVRLLQQLSHAGIQVRHARTLYEERYRRVDLDGLHPAFGVFDVRRGRVSAATRRLVDLIVGVTGLALATTLVLPALWVAVKLDDGGPLLYSQVRVGRGGGLFRIWKVRTMTVDAERSGPRYATVDDPRITRVGSLLRRTRLDELPQFWNLVRGDMTLIGPRPERPEFEEGLHRTVPAFGMRHASKPGLTGWAAVRLGYADGVAPRWEAHAYDLYYLAHRSLWLDLEICLRTVWVVLGRGGR